MYLYLYLYTYRLIIYIYIYGERFVDIRGFKTPFPMVRVCQYFAIYIYIDRSCMYTYILRAMSIFFSLYIYRLILYIYIYGERFVDIRGFKTLFPMVRISQSFL